MMWPVVFILGGAFLINNAENAAAAKILFLFPLRIPSHHGAFYPMIEELAKRGHQITAYTAFERKKPLANYEEHFISWADDGPNMKNLKTIYWRYSTATEYITWLRAFFEPMVEAALRKSEIQNLMKSEDKFDVIITPALFNQECFLAFGHKFNAPIINLNALFLSPWVAQLAGQPHSYSYIPDFRLSYIDQMNFWQRLHNTAVGTYEIVLGTFKHLPYHENLMRKYFKYPGSETLPPLRELIKNISLHLVDSHPLLNSIRPYSHNVVDVAGLNTKATGKLPADLQKFMDEAPDGVIYFSFGSLINPSLFTDNVRQMLVNTMKSLKQRVIWKWDKEVAGASNIITRSWLPQKEILAHPNCKLFITHGGYNSLIEVMSVGVPVLGMPFLADQYHDFTYYEQQGVGIEVDFDKITESELQEKIHRVIYTPSYRENAKRLSNIFHDLPQTSMERAVYWVEYVIRHKGAHHLKPASVNLPYYQYLLLDVIGFLIVSFLSTIYLLYWSIRKVLSKFKSNTVKIVQGKAANKKRN